MRRLLLLLVSEGALVGATHHLATPHRAALSDPGWLSSASAGDLGAALLHIAAWIAACWLLLGTGHDLVATALDVRAGRQQGGRVVPVWVQRITSQAVGTAMAISLLAGPAAAAGGPETPVPVQVVAPPAPVVELPIPRPAPGPPPGSASAGDQDPAVAAAEGGAPAHGRDEVDADRAAADGTVDAPAAPGGGSGDGVAVHVIAAGENLWTIARAHLLARAERGTPPGDREVHAAWVQLIALNVDTLVSGDPDLVFPGEQLRLPADLVAAPVADAAEVGS
jgi:hypothetical protein